MKEKTEDKKDMTRNKKYKHYKRQCNNEDNVKETMPETKC